MIESLHQFEIMGKSDKNKRKKSLEHKSDKNRDERKGLESDKNRDKRKEYDGKDRLNSNERKEKKMKKLTQNIINNPFHMTPAKLFKSVVETEGFDKNKIYHDEFDFTVLKSSISNTSKGLTILNLRLRDENGDLIKMTVFGQKARIWKKKMEKNNVYTISKFKLGKKDEKYDGEVLVRMVGVLGSKYRFIRKDKVEEIKYTDLKDLDEDGKVTSKLEDEVERIGDTYTMEEIKNRKIRASITGNVMIILNGVEEEKKIKNNKLYILNATDSSLLTQEQDGIETILLNVWGELNDGLKQKLEKLRNGYYDAEIKSNKENLCMKLPVMIITDATFLYDEKTGKSCIQIGRDSEVEYNAKHLNKEDKIRYENLKRDYSKKYYMERLDKIKQDEFKVAKEKLKKEELKKEEEKLNQVELEFKIEEEKLNQVEGDNIEGDNIEGDNIEGDDDGDDGDDEERDNIESESDDDEEE